MRAMPKRIPEVLVALGFATFLAPGFSVSSARADSYDDEPDDAPQGPDTPAPEPPKEKPLGAGGLDAPGTMKENKDNRTEVEKELDEADQEDSGRGLEFVWVNGEIGFQAIDLTALSGPLVAGGVESGSSGLLYGGAIGMRVLYFTLGARFRAGALSSYDLWSLALEGGMRLPLGELEPFVTLGAGIASASNVRAATTNVTLDAFGFDLRAALGADYYLSDTFSVGAQTGGDFLFLSRKDTSAAVAAGDDASVGAGFFLSAQVGLHF